MPYVHKPPENLPPPENPSPAEQSPVVGFSLSAANVALSALTGVLVVRNGDILLAPLSILGASAAVEYWERGWAALDKRSQKSLTS